MQRTIRYQGAVIRDNQILLIQHRHHGDGRSYWPLLQRLRAALRYPQEER